MHRSHNLARLGLYASLALLTAFLGVLSAGWEDGSSNYATQVRVGYPVSFNYLPQNGTDWTPPRVYRVGQRTDLAGVVTIRDESGQKLWVYPLWVMPVGTSMEAFGYELEMGDCVRVGGAVKPEELITDTGHLKLVVLAVYDDVARVDPSVHVCPVFVGVK